MSAKPTLRVHTNCEPAITPTVMLPMLSLANSADTSEAAAARPLTGRAGTVWQIALCMKNAPKATGIDSGLAAAARVAIHFHALFVIGLLTGSGARDSPIDEKCSVGGGLVSDAGTCP